MSAANRQARSATLPPSSAGRVKPDGRRIYQLVAPLIIWWTWVGVLVLGLGDLLVQGHDWISLKFGLGLLTATGMIYACTFWPKVIADEGGISVLNPFRAFRVPWLAVCGVFLADSVEVECARQAPKKNKTIYSWALSSPRRARARQQMRGRYWDRGSQRRPASYDQLPEAAKHVVKMTPAEVMARELGQLADEARAKTASTSGNGPAPAASGPSGSAADLPAGLADEGGRSEEGGAPAGGTGEVMSARWAWQPLAAIIVPAIAFTIAEIVR